MDMISRYFASIKAQLAGLTMSQRLLIGLLVVVMIATIFFTVTLSAKPEMVVLIPQSMSPEDINRVEMYLKGKYDYTADGDKIMVPADKAYAIRGELFAAQALPKDTTAAFASLIRDSSFLKTDSVSAREWNYATSETLTKMLNFFPGIESATVVIARGERPGLGRDPVPSSASVQVKTVNNEGLTSAQVVAIVDMVRGAVAGLKREDVHVTDGQRIYHAPSSDTPMPTDLMEYKKVIEDDLSRKLYTMFGDIGNVKIAVNVVPDMSQHNITETHYDPKILKATKTETSDETASSMASTASEPGYKPNVAASVDTAASTPKSSQTKSDTTAAYDNFVGETRDVSVVPAATEIKELTASISIPRSYFLSIYRRVTHDATADPTDDKLQATIDLQLQNAQKRAMNAIGAKTADQIRVDWFDDTIALKAVDVASTGSLGGGSIGGMISQYAKQAVLAAVALGVLGMMLMMVKRAVPAGAGGEIDPSAFFGNGAGGGGGSSGGKKGRKNSGSNSDMDVGDDVYGEANEGEAVLTGIELDDETLQSRKMVDEVSIMIKENPENAATLVKRWMTKGK